MPQAREQEATAPALTDALAARLAHRRWARSLVGQSGASVYRVHAAAEPEFYLKHGNGAAAAELEDEMLRLRWLSGVGRPVPDVEHFERSADQAWLLMSAVPGRTAWEWLTDHPGQATRVVRALAVWLRQLHGVPVASCPFESGHDARLLKARRRLDAGLIDESDFDGARQGWSAHAVWQEMQRLLPLAADPVVCHGDYSLDNILLDDSLQVAGVIDVARLGVADRYQDLAIMWNCLEEFGADVQRQFMAAYGIEAPDERKLLFHLLLDECF